MALSHLFIFITTADSVKVSTLTGNERSRLKTWSAHSIFVSQILPFQLARFHEGLIILAMSLSHQEPLYQPLKGIRALLLQDTTTVADTADTDTAVVQ